MLSREVRFRLPQSENVPTMPLAPEVKEELIERLWRCGVFRFGSAVRLQYGINTPVFLDFRSALYDDVATLRFLGRCIAQVAAAAFGEEIKLVGVPETGTPLAVSASVVAGSGLAVLRKTTGEAPTRRHCLMGTKEGAAKFVLVDDVMASGVSKMRCIGQLSAEALPVAGIVVVVNRHQGGDQLLEKLGYPVKHLLDIRELMDVLVSQGKIDSDTRDAARNYLALRQYSVEEFVSLLEADPAARAAIDRGTLDPLRKAVSGRL